MNQQQTPPGWYPDPSGGSGQRYWDGTQWTDQHQPAQPAQYTPAPPVGGGPPPIVDQGWQQPGPVSVAPPPQAWLGAPILFGLLLIGCIGPWATIEGFSEANVGGFDGDGGLVLGIGVVAAILLTLWRQTGKGWMAWTAAGFSALNVLIAIIDIADVSGDVPPILEDRVSVGWGLWLTLVAALGMTALSVVLALNKRRS